MRVTRFAPFSLPAYTAVLHSFLSHRVRSLSLSPLPQTIKPISFSHLPFSIHTYTHLSPSSFQFKLKSKIEALNSNTIVR